MKLFKYTSVAVFLSVITGCASVNMTPMEDSTEAKKFEMPSEGMAGIYIYRRDSMYGAAIKKDIWINGDCIGETAPGIFFYEQVKGGEDYEISTESEFSPRFCTKSRLVDSGVCKLRIPSHKSYGPTSHIASQYDGTLSAN